MGDECQDEGGVECMREYEAWLFCEGMHRFQYIGDMLLSYDGTVL